MEKRNISLDALRAFAILGVVGLHILGGVNTLQLSQGNRLVVNVFLAIMYCSVNLFGLLSGYLKIDKPHHIISIIKIVIQTTFWCFLITIICALCLDQKSIKAIIRNAFPFTGDRLWYITCYFFVFFCVPYLNLLANRLAQNEYKKMLILLTILMSLIPTFFLRDFFHVISNGYSAGWLIYMYLLGGYYKKFGFHKRATKRNVALLLLICIFTMVISKYILEALSIKLGFNTGKVWLFYYYCSPLTLLNSVCFLFLFVNISIKSGLFGKVLTWLSTVSLGVYIIHAHPYSLDNILTGENLTWTVQRNPLLTLV